MVVVGLDVGYGDTKVIGVDGKRILFPSRWAVTETESWGIGGKIPVLSTDGGQTKFIYGKYASGNNIRVPQGDGRLASKEAFPLIAAALWESGIHNDGSPVDLVIGSGTPLGTFDLEVKAAKEALENKVLTVTGPEGEVRQFNITRLIMRPQGVGAALYLLNQGIIEQQPGYGVVIDVGSRTTDVLTINLMDMEPVVELSFSLQIGVGDAISALSRKIAKETGFVVPFDLAQEALSHPVMFRQKQVGGPEVSGPILEDLANRIIENIRLNLRGEVDRVTSLIPVGGGSNLIGDRFDEIAPGTLVKIKPDDLQFANALGYRDAAERSM
ncbi:actin-like protein [Thermoplasma sp.]|uniref:actin-like protein n=1 Tax=Thermoplasma sp. TaxID=1973142 RepID=UPI001285C5C5|nr:actin-like protein [Thermoplasma sp.]KAA8923473.1 MAG: Archaeal actin-like protein [Thermoplasma sp.]